MIDWFAAMASNPVFSGVVGGALASSVLYQLRAAPIGCWNWLHKRFTVTLVIDSSEELFQRLAIYLTASPYVHRARWLRMAEVYDYEEQQWRYRPSFGLGWHLLRDHGSWFLLHRHIEQDSKGRHARRETITLRTPGSSQKAMRDLMKRAEAVYDAEGTVRVYVWHAGTYLLADHKPPRGIDKIFIPEAQKARLVQDLRRFMGARDRYRARGTPWRRGYLLEGPPGTGKTTLAFALACMARRPVYMINLGTAGGDTGLMAAFNQAEAGAVVVIEDIDTARVTHSRDASPSAPSLDVKPEESVSLAGLLNAVDGLASRENRILVVTSNHSDKLDAALLRPGRIDHRETIGLIGHVEAEAMTRAFLGDGAGAWYDQEVRPRLPIAPAELQGLLLAQAEGGAIVQIRDAA